MVKVKRFRQVSNGSRLKAWQVAGWLDRWKDRSNRLPWNLGSSSHHLAQGLTARILPMHSFLDRGQSLAILLQNRGNGRAVASTWCQLWSIRRQGKSSLHTGALGFDEVQ